MKCDRCGNSCTEAYEIMGKTICQECLENRQNPEKITIIAEEEKGSVTINKPFKRNLELFEKIKKVLKVSGGVWDCDPTEIEINFQDRTFKNFSEMIEESVQISPVKDLLWAMLKRILEIDITNKTLDLKNLSDLEQALAIRPIISCFKITYKGKKYLNTSDLYSKLFKFEKMTPEEISDKLKGN